jgi:prepilin-type N-terminal cleavage/methylation domain-containing protein
MNQTETAKRTRPAARPRSKAHDSRGFSLVELMVALGVTLVIMAVSARMLSMTLNVRSRENQRTEAVSDVQRVLQMMSREIGNAGLGLTSNGLMLYPAAATAVPGKTELLKLRVRSNLNAFPPDNDTDTDETDEDIVYAYVEEAAPGPARRYVTRQDANTESVSLLADDIDELTFDFLNEDGTAAANVAAAERVRITATVTLPAVGTEGQAGYQPPSRMRLRSEATLRNRLLGN